MIVRRIANKIIAIISLILSFVPAAGAGAAENRRGAGEHPRVCEDEEQPAPDQAGDRRRGTNHLKNKIKEPAGVVWVRLIVRMFCGAQSRQERVWWCWWWWWPPDRGLEMNFPNLAVPFPAVRRETLQTKDTPPPPPPLSACHGNCQYSPLLLTAIQQQHTATTPTPCRRDRTQTCYTPFNGGRASFQ